MNNYTPMNMPNNQGGMFSNPTNVMSAPANSSMALPKRMQDALDLVAYEKKLKEFREDNGGNSQDAPPMSQEMIDFFDNETETEKTVRMDNFQNMFSGFAQMGMFGLPGMIGSLAVSGAAPVVSGQEDYSTRSQAAYNQERQLQQALMADEGRKRAAAQASMNNQSSGVETREGSNGNVGMGGGNASRGFSSGGW
jgi:hypothetical protein